MAKEIFSVSKQKAYQKAGPEDLVELLPAPGCTSIVLPKWFIETLFHALVRAEFIHLSGPTGAAKTACIDALRLEPENFRSLCRALGVKYKPLAIHPIEMVRFDTPGELHTRRALSEGTTFDENSPLVEALIRADAARKDTYPTVWLCEIGRVHTASIQGGLLNLMTRGDIHLPDGGSIPGRGIAWVADSNYQAENDSTHTLVTFDDALKRRFTVNLTLEYPSADQETLILTHLMHLGQIPRVPGDLVARVVKLGQEIRGHKAEGNLASVAPPTIYGYESFLRMAHAMPHLSLRHVAQATLLGNASAEDSKVAAVVFGSVFALQADDDEESSMRGSMI